MATMLKSMTEDDASKLVGAEVWQKLWALWDSVKDDPQSTTLFENLARRWEEKFHNDSRPKDPSQKYTWDPAKSAYDSIARDSLSAFLKETDMDLVSLLKAEGVNFSDMQKFYELNQVGVSRKTYQLLQFSGWGLIGLSEGQEPLEVFDNLCAFMEPTFAEMRQESGRAVARFNEMRKTPNFIEYMREWLPYFYADGVMGKSTLAEHDGHSLLLDLTGLSQAGDLDPAQWCNFDIRRFAKVCELLILDVADHYKGNQQPPAQSKVGYTEQMATALTLLPAQLLLMQGVDPHQVMKGVKGRLDYLFSQTAEYAGKSHVLEDLSKLPFFHHPEYWDELGITTANFMGIDIRADNSKAEVSATSGTPTYYGISSAPLRRKIIGYCELAGIDLADPANIFRVGYGNFLPYSLATVSEDTIDEVNEHYSKRRYAFPTYVSSDATGRYLDSYSDRQVAQLFVKSITSPKNAFRFDGVTSQDQNKQALIARILDVRPDVVQVAFREVVSGTIPKKLLPKLDPYGKPAFQDLPRLPTRYRDQHFAGDLGL